MAEGHLKSVGTNCATRWPASPLYAKWGASVLGSGGGMGGMGHTLDAMDGRIDGRVFGQPVPGGVQAIRGHPVGPCCSPCAPLWPIFVQPVVPLSGAPWLIRALLSLPQGMARCPACMACPGCPEVCSSPCLSKVCLASYYVQQGKGPPCCFFWMLALG